MEDFNEPILEHYENLNVIEYSNENANPKIKIESVEFFGIKWTNKEFLKKIIGSINEAENLVDLSERLSQTFKKLEKLDIFKDVSVTIDQFEDFEKGSEVKESNNHNLDIHKVKIIFNCKEKRFNIRTGTELQRKDIAWVK